MGTVKQLKIHLSKRRAKRHYLLATTIPDHLNCGRNLAEHLRPEMGVSKRKFNRLMDRLAELGEPVTEQRL